MKKLTTDTSQTLESLKDILQDEFPEYRVRVFGVGAGRRVVVSRNLFCGVDVTLKSDGQLIVNGSLVPSMTALVMFGVGSAAGIIGGLIIGVIIGMNGSRMETEVVEALSVGVA